MFSKNAIALSAAFASLLSTVTAQAGLGDITTHSGLRGVTGYSGDGSVITAANNTPGQTATMHGNLRGMAVGADGNFYVTESWSNKVRIVETVNEQVVKNSSIIDLFAGSPSSTTAGFAGDGGSATAGSVRFSSPRGITFGNDGETLYIADYDNGRVRKVDPNGTLSTAVGGGTCDPGYTFCTQQTVRLLRPSSILVDANENLYIADAGAGRVYFANRAANHVSIVVGAVPRSNNSSFPYGSNGPASNLYLRSPEAIAVHPVTGELYISDSGNCVIHKVNNGTATVVAGTASCGYAGDGGAATSARIRANRGIAFDANGNLFMTQSDDSVVRLINTNGRIRTLAGTGVAGYAPGADGVGPGQLNQPWNTLLVGSELYVTDTGNGWLRSIHVGSAPVAQFTASPDYPQTYGTVVLDASGSFDADLGDTITYEWKGLPGGTQTGQVVQFVPPLPGSYTVTLTATDSMGLSTQSTRVVLVE